MLTHSDEEIRYRNAGGLTNRDQSFPFTTAAVLSNPYLNVTSDAVQNPFYYERHYHPMQISYPPANYYAQGEIEYYDDRSSYDPGYNVYPTEYKAFESRERKPKKQRTQKRTRVDEDLVDIKKKRDQVKSACINCRKACKKCSHHRPCDRCVLHGLEDSCRDVPRKIRSKPKNPKKPLDDDEDDDLRDLSPEQPQPALPGFSTWDSLLDATGGQETPSEETLQDLSDNLLVDRPMSTGLGSDFVLVHEAEPVSNNVEEMLELIRPRPELLPPHKRRKTVSSQASLKGEPVLQWSNDECEKPIMEYLKEFKDSPARDVKSPVDIKALSELTFTHSRSSSLDLPHASLMTFPPNIVRSFSPHYQRSRTMTSDEIAIKIKNRGIKTPTPQELTPAVTPGLVNTPP